MSTDKKCVFLGKNNNTYGDIANFYNKNIACTISIGSDEHSPSLMYKGDKKSANEDAVLAARQDDHVLLAVADSHFGQWASHSIISGLAANLKQLTAPQAIYSVLHDLCDTEYDHKENSETTLLIVLLNMSTGEGFGISFGDSSALLVSDDAVRRLNIKDSHYVSFNKEFSFETGAANEFNFNVKTGEVLVIFTDGVDECHYGYPETSVNDSHIHKLFLRNQSDIKAFVTQLASLALSGVNGNPGGQDNLAIAAVLL